MNEVVGITIGSAHEWRYAGSIPHIQILCDKQ